MRKNDLILQNTFNLNQMEQKAIWKNHFLGRMHIMIEWVCKQAKCEEFAMMSALMKSKNIRCIALAKWFGVQYQKIG